MSDYGITICWTSARPGRELDARQLWFDATEFYGKRIADGALGEQSSCFFEPTGGGAPNGIFQVWGTADQIDALAREPDHHALVLRGQLALEGYAAVRAVRGESLLEEFEVWSTQIDELV